MFKQLKDRRFSVQGKTKEEQKANVDSFIDKLDKKYYLSLKQEWKKVDKKYDKETNHGAIYLVQKRWYTRFTKLRK